MTEVTTNLKELKVLICLCAIAVVLPIAILLLSAVLTGLGQYPLSGIYLASSDV